MAQETSVESPNSDLISEDVASTTTSGMKRIHSLTDDHSVDSSFLDTSSGVDEDDGQQPQTSAGSGDSGIGMEMDILHKQSLELAEDIVGRALGRQETSRHLLPDRLKIKMRNLVETVTKKHEILYKVSWLGFFCAVRVIRKRKYYFLISFLSYISGLRSVGY